MALIGSKARIRFWSKVDKNGPIHHELGQCWVWVGQTVNGYGVMTICGTTFYTHRLSYIEENGSIPAGLIVMHKCDNRVCVNPEHLTIGTHQDNTDDREEKGRGLKGRTRSKK